MGTRATPQVTQPECTGDQTWTDAPSTNETLPLNCVNFYLSFLFCMWDGDTIYSRLPSEAEWNAAAAGGGQQRAYPWSPKEDPGNLNIEGVAKFGQGDRKPYGVGSYPSGAGRWKTQDLGGNVYEWVRDTGEPLRMDSAGKPISPYPRTPNDPIALDGDDDVFTDRVLRGGSFKHIDCATCDPKVKLRTSARSLLASYKVFNDVGFRCVRSY